MTGERIFTIPNFSAGWSCIWGLWVAWPGSHTFALNPKLYEPMLYVVPYEAFWGLLFSGAGVSAWITSYYGRKYTGALILSVVYAFFASLYFFGEYRSPGWALYLFASLVHYVFWKVNHGSVPGR